MAKSEKVLMVSPCFELARLAERVARENKFDMEIVVNSMGKALDLARVHEARGLECIISRGPTGIYLRNNLSVPVLLVRISAFDILQALYRACKINANIAYFDHVHRMNSYDFRAMEEMVPYGRIRCFYFCDMQMLNEELEIAQQEGIEVVVASDMEISNLARLKGLHSIIVDSNYESVSDAINRAKELISLQEKAQETALLMRTIIDEFDDAIIVLDENHLIKHMNQAVENMFGVQHYQYISEPFSYLPNISEQLCQLVNNNTHFKNRVFTLNQKKVIVNAIPLSLKNSFRGQIIFFALVNKIQQIEANIRQELYAKGLFARYSFDSLIGDSPKFREVINLASLYAANDSTILITGESGTGKEIFAHSIHQESNRKNGPFVSVNCSAIPENLLESELFGYQEGAFTGARKGGKIGIFELAHKGTLLLDEVSEIPLHLQARLLRVLQEKLVRRIGGEDLIVIDTRIIASTNQDLHKMVKDGTFREDLYYRLNVLNLTIPPLRDRLDDILLLLGHFYFKLSRGKRMPQFNRNLIEKLEIYNWPGNVRELENFVERLVVLTAEDRIGSFSLVMDNLIQELYSTIDNHNELTQSNKHLFIKIDTMHNMEQQILSKLCKINHQSRDELAKSLNISRTTLWKKLKEIT